MTQEKEYLVTYHLGNGVEAKQLLMNTEANLAAMELGNPVVKSFSGVEDIFYRFKLSEVKMITLKENKKTTIQDKPNYL